MSLAPYYALAFTSVGLYASLVPFTKKLRFDIPVFAFIAITMFLLGIMGAIASFFVERNFSLKQIGWDKWFWLSVFAFINFIGFALYAFVIEKIPVSEYQLIGLLSPIVGGVIAYLLLGEAFEMRWLYGLVFIGAGLFVALK